MPRTRDATPRGSDGRPLWLLLWDVPALRWPLLLVIALALAIQLHDAEWLFPPEVPYHRYLYRHWVDADRDCRDTRAEVLVRDSRRPPELDAAGCRVLAGEWYDPYTGRTVTDPKLLDIDHRVPLAEAHRSGADRWAPARRLAYANDLEDPNTLVAVSAGANRAKSDRDPVDWMPPRWGDWCDYVDRWIAVKQRWALRRDPVEWLWTETVAGICRPFEPDRPPAPAAEHGRRQPQ